MILQSQNIIAGRTRSLMLFVMILTAAVIALANASTNLLGLEDGVAIINKKPIERAYGWPIPWYWRRYTAKPYPLGWDDYNRPWIGFWRNLRAPWKPASPVSRYSAGRLAANGGIWLVLLATAFAVPLFLSRHLPQRRLRLRRSALIVVVPVIAITVLANLSSDTLPARGPSRQCSYGWPLIWYRSIDVSTIVGGFRQWDWNAAVLACNSAAWLSISLASAGAWQCTFGRCRPPVRWSLRTTFVMVTLVSALCAWFVSVRNLADEQDALITSLNGDQFLYFRRWGPRWLDLVWGDRFRRRITGAMVALNSTVDDADRIVELLRQLARVRSLRFLDLRLCVHRGEFAFRDEMAAALVDMRHLETLNLDCATENANDSHGVAKTWLAAVGQLSRLRRMASS